MPRWPSDYVPVRYRLDERLAEFVRDGCILDDPMNIHTLAKLRHGPIRHHVLRAHLVELQAGGVIWLSTNGTLAGLTRQRVIDIVLDDDVVGGWFERRLPKALPQLGYLRDLLNENRGHALGRDRVATLRTCAYLTAGSYEPDRGSSSGELDALLLQALEAVPDPARFAAALMHMLLAMPVMSGSPVEALTVALATCQPALAGAPARS
jgi:hypothetical protein